MTDNQIALIHAASDSVLVERLFNLAREGMARADEFSAIGAEVYDRFARAYGQDPTELEVIHSLAA